MNSPHESIWIGFDRRQAHAFAVTRYSITRYNKTIPIMGLVLDRLMSDGLYTRPMNFRSGKMWDSISDAGMSTEFAVSRFLVPHLARYGWALFLDCDVICLENISKLFALADDSKAVMCVKHEHVANSDTKMDGQVQQNYHRKNWSSVMLFNCEHPSNRRLTTEMINGVPGRDLHRFCWLEDEEIGELPQRWNYLVGYHTREIEPNPAIVHFTNGLPDIPGIEQHEYSAMWHGMIPYAVGAL